MKCSSNTQDGQPCRTHARAGSEFCIFHDPEYALQRRAAQSTGGSKSSQLKVMPTPPFDIDLDDPRRIPKLLTFLANGVVRGDLDAKVAYAVGYLADCAMRAHKAGELTERVEQMERLQRVEQATPISSPSSSPQFEEEEDRPTVS
jgi:hypothetical protein